MAHFDISYLIRQCKVEKKKLTIKWLAKNDYKQSRWDIKECFFVGRSVFTFTLKQNGPCIVVVVVTYAETATLMRSRRSDVVHS